MNFDPATGAGIAIVLPAKNEATGLAEVLPRLTELYPQAQITVVDDGSTDDTAQIAQAHGVHVLRRPLSMGNGAAVKAGARAAENVDTVVFMDADGQHQPGDVGTLLAGLNEGYDMCVGARRSEDQASQGRRFGNACYNWFASLIVGHKVKDLTSGFRAVHARKFKEFLHLLPNGFSYPTTSTMAFFRAGYGVKYEPVHMPERHGESHISPLKDGIRFLVIIFKIGTLYSPLKIFAPASAVLFTTGFAWALYTLTAEGRFTNMSVLLFLTAIVVFLIGLVSEQVTTLLYKND